VDNLYFDFDQGAVYDSNTKFGRDRSSRAREKEADGAGLREPCSREIDQFAAEEGPGCLSVESAELIVGEFKELCL
jgi:hypothetical protein